MSVIGTYYILGRMFLLTKSKSDFLSNIFSHYRAQKEEEQTTEQVDETLNNQTELNVEEKECCKINFQFYDKTKQGFVERFELPMLLTSTFH